MKTVIEGVTYYARTAKIKLIEVYYPVVAFYGTKIGSQSFHINIPQPTRGKALTIAKRHIRNLKNS